MNDRYREELLSSLKRLENDLESLSSRLLTVEDRAKLNLYFATGNVERNKNNERQSTECELSVKKSKDKADQVISMANTTVTAATNALHESQNAISNLSTAASKMQLAASAISAMASDVAGVLAVASAMNVDSDINMSVATANGQAEAADNLAKKVSLASITADIKAADAGVENVNEDAVTLLTTLTKLKEVINNNYENTSEGLEGWNDQLRDSISAQSVALANYEISEAKYKAVDRSKQRLNEVVNHDLQLFDSALTSADHKFAAGKSLSISFRSFPNEDEIQSYRLFVVPRDQVSVFNKAVARGLYENFIEIATKCHDKPASEISEKDVNRYYRSQIIDEKRPVINTGKTFQYHITCSDESERKGDQCSDIRHFWKDFSGKDIIQGESYVAFIYTKLKPERARSTGIETDYLSLPSQPLTLRFELPRVDLKKDNVHISCAHSLTDLRICFDAQLIDEHRIPIEEVEKSIVDYRVVLVSDANLIPANNKDVASNAVQYGNAPTFPFDAKAISNLTPALYASARDRSLVSSRKNEPKHEFEKLIGELAAKIEKDESWKAYGGSDIEKCQSKWLNYFGETITEDEILNGCSLLMDCLSSPDTQVLEERPGFKRLEACPGTAATDNYGIPLSINTELIDLLFSCLATCVLLKLKGHAHGDFLEVEKEGIRKKLSEGTTRQNYQILIWSAYNGQESDRNSYIETYSTYSVQSVSLYY